MKETKKFLFSIGLFGIVILISIAQSANVVSFLPTSFNYVAQVGDEIIYNEIEEIKIYDNSAENFNQYSRSEVRKFTVKNITRINSTNMNMGYEYSYYPNSTAYCESNTKWALNLSYSLAFNNTSPTLMQIPMLPMDVNVSDIVTTNILYDIGFFQNPYDMYQNDSGITYEIEVVSNTTTPSAHSLEFSASGQLNYNVRTTNVTIMATTVTIQNFTTFVELNCIYDTTHIVRNFSYYRFENTTNYDESTPTIKKWQAMSNNGSSEQLCSTMIPLSSNPNPWFNINGFPSIVLFGISAIVVVGIIRKHNYDQF